ncbi:MAG: alpha-galactosidase, partial [Calditrichia bacterium]
MIQKALFATMFTLLMMTGYLQSEEFTSGPWTVKVDPVKATFSISHKDLGELLSGVRLNMAADGKLTKLEGWQSGFSDGRLTISTSRPVASEWEFRFSEDKIDVSTSAGNGRITALMPAPANRFPARIADPGKMQESETGEENDYTGVTQVEKYYVPPKNPQVMYLSLGPVDAPNLHAVFDKASDAVIRFSPGSKMVRSPQGQTFLEITTSPGKKGNWLTLIPNYYVDVLGMAKYVPYDDTYHKSAPTGWNHWLAFFRQVTEKDIVEHADYISKNLKPYGMVHCQLDDGYDHVDRRRWSQGWDPQTFPHGPEWLANYIKSKGLIPGLWTVPYCYSVKDANPDWFLRDDKGKILMDYQGGGELDFTRPEVVNQYWIPLWKELKRQGWEYFKFDMGNTSWMWYHYQHNFSDTTVSSFDVSHKTMILFRDIMGPQVWYTNHPDAYGGRMGFIDVAGCGRDPGPGWEQMNHFLEVISNNAYQNHIIWYSDPDCIVLRGKPTRADSILVHDGSHARNDKFLTLEEARTCASLLSLSGMQYLDGDDLLHLQQERLNLIKKTIPTLPIFPIDLFGRSRSPEHYPEIMDLKVNQPSGIYDVIAVTNWTNEQTTRKVGISSELSLNSGDGYLVFDNWKETLVGRFDSEFQTVLSPHGTGVFTIRRQENHPQLLATNRHISGAVSIRKTAWNASDRTLSGISETVPGAQ